MGQTPALEFNRDGTTTTTFGLKHQDNHAVWHWKTEWVGWRKGIVALEVVGNGYGVRYGVALEDALGLAATLAFWWTFQDCLSALTAWWRTELAGQSGGIGA